MHKKLFLLLAIACTSYTMDEPDLTSDDSDGEHEPRVTLSKALTIEELNLDAKSRTALAESNDTRPCLVVTPFGVDKEEIAAEVTRRGWSLTPRSQQSVNDEIKETQEALDEMHREVYGRITHQNNNEEDSHE